jgi:hypothetical protein
MVIVALRLADARVVDFFVKRLHLFRLFDCSGTVFEGNKCASLFCVILSYEQCSRAQLTSSFVISMTSDSRSESDVVSDGKPEESV